MGSFRVPSSTPDLPLLRTRLVLNMLSQLVFTILGSLCLKVILKHRDIQHRINHSVPDGVSVKLGYTDIKTATIVLCVLSHITTLFLSKIMIFHLQDIYGFIPLSIAKKLHIVKKRLASTTLGYQAIGLAFLFVHIASLVGIFTWLTFTREQWVIVDAADNVKLPELFGPQLLKRLRIPLAYRDTGYIMIVAIFPWIAVFFTALLTITTALAWRKRRIHLALTSSRNAQGNNVEMVVVDETT